MEEQNPLSSYPGVPPAVVVPPVTPPVARTTPAAVPAAWRESLRQYGVAVAVAAFLCLMLSTYLLYRRGYYNLYIGNKVLAGVAAVMLGIVLLLGPLGKYFNAFDRYLKYRKELGMVAAVLAIAHGVVSFFFLPAYFPRERFFTYGRWPFLLALAATVILVVLVAISNRPMMHRIGGKWWWRLQRWGVRLAFVLVALHVGVMKWQEWLQWYQQGGSAELNHPEWPGAGLLVGWFMGFVLLVRITDVVHPKLGTLAWYVSIVGFPAAVIGTFWWGQRLT